MSELGLCPACGERLLTRRRHIDRTVRCPACRHDFVLRAPQAVLPARRGDVPFDLPAGTGRPAVPALRGTSRTAPTALHTAAPGW